jgi:hypothetical protein
MATRSGSSFQKRQKEKARQEKQREKLERRISRKDEKPGGPEIDYSYNPFADTEDYPLPPEMERAGIV